MDGKTGMDCMLMRGSQQPSAGNWSSLPDVANDSPQWPCLTPVRGAQIRVTCDGTVAVMASRAISPIPTAWLTR